MNKIQKFIHRFIIPNEKNNFKSRVLHTDYLTYYLLFALLLMVSVKHIHTRFPNILGFATDISVQKLFELTNNQRRSADLSPLILNNKLSQAAEKKAQDMFTKNYWSHFGPAGETPWDFILGSGYQYEFAGENLAKNFLFSQGVIDAWMRSTTHRENLLRSEYSEVGYAVVNGQLNGEETTLVVQMFGKPMNAISASTLPEPVQTIPKENSAVHTPVGNDMQNVLGNNKNRSFINLFSFSIDATYFFLVFFIIVLLVDFFIASKLHIIRVSGKNLAHIIFVGFVLAAVAFVLKMGTIL